ncbi:hypothetical protein MTHERMMSTA1_24300 [Methanosarcina thermophila MST-A1]|uniref:Glutamate dehydrogenase n=1 Tax=Methanosarcina thermophila TaxID=2210 RepID=A0A3G9CYY5_METTE|nr:glutamate dehydrogenase [Methanosarcina thermophila]GLI15304.1 hypothetical protein MTHERMMSTA1_24300 [Methanosarcina thermophila MST-A1]
MLTVSTLSITYNSVVLSEFCSFIRFDQGSNLQFKRIVDQHIDQKTGGQEKNTVVEGNLVEIK